MDIHRVEGAGFVLLGCGKMGSAMLQGWLNGILKPQSVHVIDPQPSEWVRSTGVGVNDELPPHPAVVLIAVKPQMMGEALPTIRSFGNGDTLFISIAAGTSIETLEETLGANSPIIRAMPNTPAAVGKGITAIIGNGKVSTTQMDMAETLLGAVGEVVRLDDEYEMDAITGVSGSGPAYVFYMIECLAAAARDQGLDPDLSMQLAKATVAGAGALAQAASETPEELRVNVTSPNGTTQAGLEILMDKETGLHKLMIGTVEAASFRSRELRDG